MKYMSVGDRVLVHIPQGEVAVNSPVINFHRQEMKIADRKVVGNTNNVYYTLVGAESEFGIPYSFLRDWLIPL